jgi:hypothetical protein
MAISCRAHARELRSYKATRAPHLFAVAAQ